MLESLVNDVWKLQVAPSIGASIFGLSVRAKEGWQPILRETPESALQKGSASPFSSFTLAPFSNRLKDARFDFLGESYQLKANADGNTQHGDVRNRPWELVFKSETQLDFEIDTSDFTDFNFPFPFQMSVRYTLEDNVFATRFELKNTGSKHMPAGFGIHPYFNRSIAGSDEVLLTLKAEGLYEVKDLIPTGNVPKPTGPFDFSETRAVQAVQLNDLYRDWSDLCLTWPDVASVEIYADALFRHLVAFTHEDGSLALEPVTNATDGFNLMAQGIDRHGVKVLAPGEQMSGSIFFRLS